MSPQSSDQQTSATAMTFSMDGKHGKITMKDNGDVLSCSLDKRTNLPILTGLLGSALNRQTVELNLCITDKANQNLSADQTELLRWHFKLGLLNFKAIQLLLRTSALSQ